MKKRWFVKGCVIGFITMTIVACGSTQTEQKTENNTQEITKENAEKDTEQITIYNFMEKPLDLETSSLEYDLQTDDQPYFFWSSATKSEYGYYYFNGCTLMFFDKKSQKSVPLCNKADCIHNDTKCNAYFDTLGNANISTSKLQYYEGNLYLVGYDSEGYTSLFRISADGTSQEKYMTLYKADLSSAEGGTHWRSPDFCIHRGYVYYIDSKESMPKIRRMKLGTTETEIVFQTSGIRPNLYRMLGYGDYIFFQTGNYTDETCEKTKGGIYAYNIQTGSIQLVKADAISTYIIVKDTIYYNYNGNTEFRSFDLKTLEDKVILKDIEGHNVSADEYYIYKFSDSGILSVYNHEGYQICTVSGEITDCYFSDGIYILGSGYDYDNEKEFGCFIEVSAFASKNAKWTYLNADK